MNEPLDPRLHAFRPDLADVRLRDRVAAACFVTGALARVQSGRLAMFAAAHGATAMSSELRAGELVDIFERKHGIAWVQNHSDGYVGYVAAAGLIETLADPAWRIRPLLAYIYPEPTVKAVPLDMLPFPARVAVAEPLPQGWSRLQTGGYLYTAQLEAAAPLHPDYAFTAGRLLGVPYLWGGRTAQGIDCSGLVQLALELAGIACPRDSDQQRLAFGVAPPTDWTAYPFTRGDLVFFPGHVGIMADGTHLIHANAYHMQVSCEPLSDVVTRGAPILAIGASETLCPA
jgi:hypothetical protein